MTLKVNPHCSTNLKFSCQLLASWNRIATLVQVNAQCHKPTFEHQLACESCQSTKMQVCCFFWNLTASLHHTSLHSTDVPLWDPSYLSHVSYSSKVRTRFHIMYLLICFSSVKNQEMSIWVSFVPHHTVFSQF